MKELWDIKTEKEIDSFLWVPIKLASQGREASSLSHLKLFLIPWASRLKKSFEPLEMGYCQYLP